MRERFAQAAFRILAQLAPAREREALLGDLTEEYAQRAAAGSARAARLWCLRQVLASVPPLLWWAIARSAGLATLGVALLAYASVGAVEFAVNGMIALAGASPTGTYHPAGMFITAPSVVLIAYLAAGRRRAAPFVLGAMMLAAVALMSVTSAERIPGWYRMAYFVVGPAAAVLGGVLRSRWSYRTSVKGG